MSHTHVYVNCISAAIHLHPRHVAALSVKIFFFAFGDTLGDAFGVLLIVRAHSVTSGCCN